MEHGTAINGRPGAVAAVASASPVCDDGSPVTVASDTRTVRAGTTTVGASNGPQQYAHNHAVATTLKQAMQGLP